jgi:hypothetical protein
MYAFIHCGLPKTGTTSLQKWLASNEGKLRELGVCYPREYRDEEGIAHHNLNTLVGHGSKYLADCIRKVAITSHAEKVIFSAEGLSNLLGKEDDYGLSFFHDLLAILRESCLEPRLLFTLRRADKYIKSIIVQNILYDGLREAPSEYAGHALSALTRVYASLSNLLKIAPVQLYSHSSVVNEQIIESIIAQPLSSCDEFTSIQVEHVSPDESVLQFFMWLNIKGYQIPSDFHSYLRFHPGAHEILLKLKNDLFEKQDSYEDFVESWEPSAGLVDSCLRFFSMAWAQCLSYKARSSEFNNLPSFVVLRKRLSEDIQGLIPKDLARLDYMHCVAAGPYASRHFSDSLESLLSHGSSVQGQDFGSQIKAKEQLERR